MTAEEIALQLKLPLSDYFRATVFNPRFVSQPKLVTLRVEPSRYVNKSEQFRVPREGALETARQLTSMFEAARQLMQ